MKRRCTEGDNKSRSVRVGGGDAARGIDMNNLADRMRNGMTSRMLTNGTVTIERLSNGIWIEGSVLGKTSQYDQDKAHASMQKLINTDGFLDKLEITLLSGNAAEFELDLFMQVKTNIEGYENELARASLELPPPPKWDTVFECLGPSQHYAFQQCYNHLTNMLGCEEGRRGFVHKLFSNDSVSFHIEKTPGGGVDMVYSLTDVPDGVDLDVIASKLVNDLLQSEGFDTLVKKLAAHLVQVLYTGAGIHSEFKLENKSGCKVITSNIDQQATGPLYLHNDIVVRGNPKESGAILGFPGRVVIKHKNAEDFMDSGHGVKDSKVYPGNLTPRAQTYIDFMAHHEDEQKALEILRQACGHLRAQLYEVGFFV